MFIKVSFSPKQNNAKTGLKIVKFRRIFFLITKLLNKIV